MATVAQSEQNHNTADSRVEHDLRAFHAACSVLDTEMMAVDHRYRSNGRLDDDEITKAGELATKLSDQTKLGNKKVASLKKWFDA